MPNYENNSGQPCGMLAPNQIPEHPWQCISVNLITELPTSQGYDAMLVIVDRFTKMIRLVPTYTTLSSEGIACLFQDHIWKDFGILETIISDRGSISKFMTALNHTYWEFKPTHPLHITHKPMVRLNE